MAVTWEKLVKQEDLDAVEATLDGVIDDLGAGALLTDGSNHMTGDIELATAAGIGHKDNENRLYFSSMDKATFDGMYVVAQTFKALTGNFEGEKYFGGYAALCYQGEDTSFEGEYNLNMGYRGGDVLIKGGYAVSGAALHGNIRIGKSGESGSVNILSGTIETPMLTLGSQLNVAIESEGLILMQSEADDDASGYKSVHILSADSMKLECADGGTNSKFEVAADTITLEKRLTGLITFKIGAESLYLTDFYGGGFIQVDTSLRTNVSAPASASATGVLGQIAKDDDYIYIATATDEWKRVAISSW